MASRTYPVLLVDLPVSRDFIIKAGLIAVVVAVNTLLIRLLNLHLPPADLVKPVGVCCLLGLFAAWYYHRGEMRFVMCLTALGHLVVFTSAYTVLMYSLAALNAPLADAELMTIDRAFGVHTGQIADWARRNPAIGLTLALAYDTLMWQTPLLVVVLGFAGRCRELEGFVLQFMLTTVITAAIFACVPAEGPFVAYGFEPNDGQQRYLDHFHALRSGERSLVSWRDAEGLITFPSFHTTWAILLAWGLRRHRYLRVPVLLLNLAVIASTLTTGWHYFADVLGGALVAAAGIVAAKRLEPWIYGSPARVRPG